MSTVVDSEILVGPASYAQERMWVAEQLAEGEPAYNLQTSLRVRGRLDLGVLRRSLDEVVRRHDAFRTRFVADGTGLRCEVRPPRPVPFDYLDLTADPAPERIAARVRAELDTRFDPASGDTYRFTVLRTGTDEHVVLLTMDHLVGDAWSVQVVYEDLVRAYAQGIGRTAAPDPAAPAYRDFVAWQRGWMNGEECAEQLAYWKDQLPVRPPRLTLPTRPGARRPRDMRRFTSTLDGATVAAATTAASNGRASLFTVLFAGYTALLARYAQQTELVVGSLCGGRTQPETERMVGFFANAVALRADLSGRPSLRELVRRAREVVLDAFENQDVPFDAVVSAVGPERPSGARPFFDVMFQLADARREPVDLGDAVIEPLPNASKVAGADLVLTVSVEADGHLCHWDYDAGLLDDGTVERFDAHYRTLLAAALAEPDRPLADVEILTGAELATVAGFSAGPLHPGVDWSLAGAFEAVVARQPGRPALSGTVEATYAEFNAEANRLAHVLRDRGVGPESVVGLYLDDRADVVRAALGVLKSGGAYLPLDPGYPPARIAFMIEDAAPAYVLTRPGLVDRLPAGARPLVLDDLATDLAAAPTGNPVRDLAPDGLAYVIYTSGSTGRPKGVGVVHRGLAVISAAQREAFGLAPDDRVLQFASPNFDASVLEALMAFGAGATLCLPAAEASAHADVEEMIRTTGATAALLPPSALGAIVAEDTTLTTITVGGAACPAPLAKRWAARGRFYNLYGPTEASIVSTSYLVDPDGPADAVLPIGRPLAGVAAYVVQDGGTLAPVGVPGELWLGGPVLARGYLGRPALTADRFVPDRWGPTASARLYRTGDLVRWREDGVLEFLGRSDEQVKVRGYRIELGEVESCLAAHPGVAEVMADARDDRLYAFVGTVRGSAPTAEELRVHCAQALPDYMVPATVVVLDTLPKTPNGKIDRSALPDPGAVDRSGFVAPRNELETLVAEIWAEVLGVPEVGALDDFFVLGGHSLAATRVVSRVRQAFEVGLPVRTLFTHPVLGDFVAALVRWEQSDG